MSVPLMGDLQSRISELSTRYLDPQIAKELDPTFDPHIDDIAAFRLLAHAEIEQFMEGVTTLRLDELKASSSRGDPVSSYPWIYSVASILGMSLAFDSPWDQAKFKQTSGLVIDSALRSVSDNNGVKSTTLLKFSVFCGFYVDQIDATLAANLTAFGRSRGDVAHQSSKRVRTINSPSTEKAEVLALVTALEKHFLQVFATAA
jgi:hypothetical protein